MITQVYQFKNLPQEYKTVLNQTLENSQTVYVIKDKTGIAKSITTNVCQAIKKTQK
jgi:hypothetical protein